MLPDESMLSLPRRRSDVRNVAESVAAGEQRFDGTPVTAAAPATPDSGDTRSTIDRKRFCSATPATAAVLCQRRQRRRHADGAADAATLTRAPRCTRAHPRTTQHSRQAAAAAGDSRPQDKDEDHQLEQDTQS